MNTRVETLADAALEGAKLRLRPILMTSFAFILGCVPLWIATGARSVARQIMGTTVIGGMVAAKRGRNIFRARDFLYGGEVVRRRQAPGSRRTAGNDCAVGGRLSKP